MKIFHKIKKALKHWIYRDSDTGKFISRDEFKLRDPKTTEREKVQ